MITTDPSTWPTGDLLWQAAQAVAWAEGYNIPGSVPNRYNNPGDLTQGDEWGQRIQGYSTDGRKIINFYSPEAGWNALKLKLLNILNGRSRMYSPGWTWLQIGQQWAGGDLNWGSNVAARLNADPGSSFASFFGSQAGAVPVDPGPGEVIPPDSSSAAGGPSVPNAGTDLTQIPGWVWMVSILGLGLVLLSPD